MHRARRWNDFWEKEEKDIHDLATKLRESGVDLDQEDDVTVFLGVSLDHNNETVLLEMRQDRPIEQIF